MGTTYQGFSLVRAPGRSAKSALTAARPVEQYRVVVLADHSEYGRATTETNRVKIDDDASMRQALARLFRSVDLNVEVFGSTADLLRHKFPDAPSCLVLDVRLPGLSGLDFQGKLAKAGTSIPIIFMTGHGDIPMSVHAIKAGAVDFLTKPFRDQDMLDAVRLALEKDRVRRKSEGAVTGVRERFETLSTREREIMALVIRGLMNKQVAAEAGLSLITVKIHRGHVIKKMQAKSLADLVRMADTLGMHRNTSRET
jgi:FixJ family two-component response regulator